MHSSKRRPACIAVAGANSPARDRISGFGIDAFIMGGGLQAEIRHFGTFDSTRTGFWRAKAGRRVLAATIHAPNRTIQKYPFETVTCNKISITTACYLCNTGWKRRRVRLLEAVPLLRVQKSSVIVIGRRRGASRGRPVRWFA
jgi:hypothetical protein